MSFDPSSYSNSDLITNSHSGQSDMPFNPSSYSNYNLMTSYHAQPNAPFNPTSYDNSNLMMSSIGSYSDMAQVKHVPYDPFEYQRRTAQYNSNALAWDEVREHDELNEPHNGLSSKPKPHNHLQKTLNNLIGIKDTSTQPIIKSSAKHYLSEDERRSVKQIDDPHLIALTELGDRYHKKHKYKKEADYHRKVQEKLRSDEYKNDHTHVNVASMDSYGRNSAAIHNPDYTNYYSSLGYTFDDIFKQSKPYNQYKPGERVDYIPIWIKGFYKDPLAIQWINNQCRDT